MYQQCVGKVKATSCSYPIVEVIQLLPTLLNKLLQRIDPLPINRRLLQRMKQSRYIPNLLHTALLHHPRPHPTQNTGLNPRQPSQTLLPTPHLRRVNRKIILIQHMRPLKLTPTAMPSLRDLRPKTHPPPPAHERVKPGMRAAPLGGPKRKRVLPALLVDVTGHVDVPSAPGPFPAWIGDLGVGDVHGAGALVVGHPGGGVEVEEGAVRVEGDAEEEPAALVFVEDV